MAEILRLEILGHACLLVETTDVRLIVDPWLLGSCYWRSWWNYPEIASVDVYSLKPTHIYLTHLHWDHYHGPTLRAFERFRPEVLLPRSATSRMMRDLSNGFKFNRVREVVHGQRVRIGSKFWITSYQFNPWIVDSALIIEAADKKIFNVNDSKVFGVSLRQILRRHGHFDFALRSHSSAVQVPYCVRGGGSLNLVRTPSDYISEFHSFMAIVSPTYAVPFASNHVYLHNNSVEFNRFYSSPAEVQDFFRENPLPRTTCVVMPNGSSWDSQEGFSLRSHDYSGIEEDISSMRAKHNDSLQRAYQRDNATKVNWHAFDRYFDDFLRALRFSLIYPEVRLGIMVSSNLCAKSATGMGLVDLASGKVERVDERWDKNCDPDEIIVRFGLDFLLMVMPSVFNDCNTKKMYNVWGPSKLLRIHISDSSSLSKYTKFCLLIDLYENDGLPLWRFFEPRQLVNRLLRWRELIDAIIFWYKIKFRSGNLASLWK